MECTPLLSSVSFTNCVTIHVPLRIVCVENNDTRTIDTDDTQDLVRPSVPCDWRGCLFLVLDFWIRYTGRQTDRDKDRKVEI